MNRFLKSNHLRQAHEFDRIYKLGHKWVSEYWVAYFQQCESHSLSKIGIVASRKVGKATTRNRIKRTVREWFRCQDQFRSVPVELIIVARKRAALQNDSAKLITSLNQLQSNITSSSEIL